jgi:hypothetical protein
MNLFKKIAMPALVAMIVLSATTVAVSAKEFPDVREGQWFYPTVSKWSNDDYGVLAGYESGLFKPDAPMTLAELTTVLSKTFGYHTAADVPENSRGKWYSNAYAQAVAADIISGNPAPEKILTRQESAEIIAKAFGIAPLSARTTFDDDGAIDAAYAGYAAALQEAGVFKGMGNDNFEPLGNFTRAQIMTVLDALLDDIIDKDVTGRTVDGNLLVRKSGVILKDTTVSGDLVIAHGVADGDVTLDNVKVSGKLAVYGGGSHSIIITGGSQIQYAVINKQDGDGEAVNVRVEKGSTVTALEINEGSAAMVTGNIAEINVSANATLEVAEGSVVERVVVDGDTVTIYVRDGATTHRITIKGDEVTIQGEGRVDAVTVESGVSGAEVGTKGTTITNNGTDAVKTGDGEVAPGATGTTGSPAPASSGGGSSSSSGSSSPATAVTVGTLAELRSALQNAVVKTITVSAILQNYETDITIPEGKTVVFIQDAGLRVRNLVVDGDLYSDGGNVVLTVFGTLSGKNVQKWFHDLSDAYKPNFYGWWTVANGVTSDGWYPTSVETYSQAGLTEALAVDTIGEIHLNGSFSIANSFSIYSLHINADVTIPAGVTVSADVVAIWESSLTAQNGGTLSNITDAAQIVMYGDSTVTLGNTSYKGPDADFFSYGVISRRIPWEDGAWGTPYLRNNNTGSTNIFVETGTLADIDYLAETFPELKGVHIYGYHSANGYPWLSFGTDHTFTVTAFPVQIHGNQTFGYGEEEAYTIDPVLVDAGVTLTIEDEVTVRLKSDSADLNAIVGTDETSVIIVKSGAIVVSSYGPPEDDSLWESSSWEAGTYKWNAGTEQWDKQ